MVLLNDSNHTLPLSTGTSSIAVVGPLADDPLDQLGPDVPIGYDTTAADLKTKDQIVSVLDGIKAAAPNATVNYAPGCTFTPTDTCSSTSGFGAAVAAAQPRRLPWWSSVSRRRTRARRPRGAISTCPSSRTR